MSLARLRHEEDYLHAQLAAVRERLASAVAASREIARLETELDALESNPPPPSSAVYRTASPFALTELREKVAAVRRERMVRATLRLEEAELLSALERSRKGLQDRGIRKTQLPILETVSVAAPCSARWDEMDGDGDVRFCLECQKHVFNLSMMSREEAEAVLTSARATGGSCVRFYRRTDGTLLTQDCPVGARQRRYWRRASGIAAAGILFCIGTIAYAELVSNTAQCPTGTSAASMGFN
jgi:hypothetical protein